MENIKKKKAPPAEAVEEKGIVNDDADESKQYRKFFVTQLNPQEYGLGDPDQLKKKIENETMCKYACFCYETAPTTGTRHFHLYLEYYDGRKFRTIHNLFPHAHIQAARGDIIAIRDYITKTGKYADTDSAKLNDRLTFREIGKTDSESRRQKNTRNEKIMSDIRKGRTAVDIINENPELMLRSRQISDLAQLLRFDNIPDFRNVEVIYVSGDTGLGKTSMVYAENAPKDVCRLTSYPKRGDVKFDSYMGQKVLVFEEFRSQVDISSMLNYTDNYKVWLPARYSDKVSVYNKVYIISNWSLEEQYVDIQRLYPLTWKAFIRRIDKVRIFSEPFKYTEFTVRLDDHMRLIYEAAGTHKVKIKK